MSERKEAVRGLERKPLETQRKPEEERRRPVSSIGARGGRGRQGGRGMGGTPSPDLQRNASFTLISRPSPVLVGTPTIPTESSDSNSLSSPFRKYAHVSPRVDSGLPRKRSRVNLLPEFSNLLTPAEDQLFASFVAMPASTAEMLTREQLFRKRCEANRSSYDALLLRIIQHYYETDPSKHDSEISLLKSLLGNLDESSLPALRLLPCLPEDVKALLAREVPPEPSLPTSLLEAEAALNSAVALLTVKRFDCLRSVKHPSHYLQRVTAGYLCLFSKVDQYIEVTPGFHLVVSRAWETWQAYIKQPGHVVQTARGVGEMLKTGKIGPGEMKECKSILNDLKSRPSPDSTLVDESASILHRFLTAVCVFYSEWIAYHPDLHPKKALVDLNKSSDRLSKPKSTPNSQFKPAAQPSAEPTDFSLILDSPARHSNEAKDVRIPSFGPGQFNMTETSIPSLDFEAVIVEPLDGGEEGSGEAKREEEEGTMRVKEETSRGERKTMTSSEMTMEWELELSLRRLIQEKITRQGGDFVSLSAERLTGEAWSHSANLFSELQSITLTQDWTEKHVKAVGIDRFDGILREFEEKMKEAMYLKREIGKAVLRVKTEAERVERERHYEKLKAQKTNK